MSFASAFSSPGSRAAAVSRSAYQSLAAEPDDVDIREYNELHAQVTQYLLKLSNANSKVSRWALLMGTDRDSAEVRSKIKKALDIGNKLIAKATAAVDVLTGRPGLTVDEKQRRRIATGKAAKDLQTQAATFRELAKSVARKEAQFAGVRLAAHSAAGGSGLGSASGLASAGGTDPGSDESALDAARAREVQDLATAVAFNEAVVLEQERGVEELEATVREVNEIFKDMAELVNEQGEKIDFIDATVTEAADHVDKGTKDLEVAEKIQKKTRSKRWLLIIFVILAFVAAMMLKKIFV
jgi:hypothetical protein